MQSSTGRNSPTQVSGRTATGTHLACLLQQVFLHGSVGEIFPNVRPCQGPLFPNQARQVIPVASVILGKSVVGSFAVSLSTRMPHVDAGIVGGNTAEHSVTKPARESRLLFGCRPMQGWVCGCIDLGRQRLLVGLEHPCKSELQFHAGMQGAEGRRAPRTATCTPVAVVVGMRIGQVPKRSRSPIR